MTRTVAIIGASPDRSKFGNKALRAWRQQGYRVIPINPHASEVEGEPAYGSVLDVPDRIDDRINRNGDCGRMPRRAANAGTWRP